LHIFPNYLEYKNKSAAPDEVEIGTGDIIKKKKEGEIPLVFLKGKPDSYFDLFSKICSNKESDRLGFSTKVFSS